MPPRLVSGDVLEVEFPKVPSPEVAFPEGGYGYLTYVGKFEKRDAVRVRPGVLYERPQITEDLFAESYIAFYPANLALKHKLVSVVGKLAPVPMPTVFRRGGWRVGERITAHLLDIDDGTKVTTFLKYKLTDEEKKINLADGLNHEALLIQMSKGWKPELDYEDATPPDEDSPPEGPVVLPPPRQLEPIEPAANEADVPGVPNDTMVLEEVARQSDITQARNIRHYLYFPTKKVAQSVATELRKQGYEVKVDRAAIGKSWLVLASHAVVLTGEYIARTRQGLEDLAQSRCGEYDGWEAAIS